MALPILFKFKLRGRKVQIVIVRQVIGHLHEIVPTDTTTCRITSYKEQG